MQLKITENENLRRELNKEEYNKEYQSILRDEINEITTKHLTETEDLQTEIDELKRKIFEKDEEIVSCKEKNKCIISSCEMYKAKLFDLELLIEQKDKDLSRKKIMSKNKDESVVNQLKEENAHLKISIWQRESDIEKMKELMKKKDNTIGEHNAEIIQYKDKVQELKIKNAADRMKLETSLLEKERVINYMQDTLDKTEIERRKNVEQDHTTDIHKVSQTTLNQKHNEEEFNEISEEQDVNKSLPDLVKVNFIRKKLFVLTNNEFRKIQTFSNLSQDALHEEN